MSSYYNENDPAAAHCIRALIADKVIAAGDVDDRSIMEVTADDIRRYKQCHFFAGGALWQLALRAAGWEDDRPVWTGSCPCQPFSAAGKHQGTDDPRHLWPHLYRLICEVRPDDVFGEQVSGKAGYGWLDGVCDDLEAESYTVGAADIAACAIDAPHQRSRLYWHASLGHSSSSRFQGVCIDSERVSSQQSGGGCSNVSDAVGQQRQSGQDAKVLANPDSKPRQQNTRSTPEYEGANGGWTQDNHRLSGGDESSVGEVEHSESNRRREGWAESEFRSGRSAAASADAQRLLENPNNTKRGQNGIRRADAESHTAERKQDSDSTDKRNAAFSYWGNHWIECYDGKARRAKPSIRFLADGLQLPVDAFSGESPANLQETFPKNRIEAWRIAGNAIVPQLAAAFIRSAI